MVVIYYVQTYYLDSALETIISLKNIVDLHLVIELTPESKVSNIININSLDGLNRIENFDRVVGTSQSKLFNTYFDGLLSVNFVLYKHKKSFSLHTLIDSLFIASFINNLNPDVIHFDSASIRSSFLMPFLLKTKKYLTIHDPVSHSGEESWKSKLSKHISLYFVKGVFFYSKYALNVFNKIYPDISLPRYKLKLQPFSFNSNLNFLLHKKQTSILFFGRISYYKGIDLLLDAIPKVLFHFPSQIFIIAGKSENFFIDYNLLKKYEENILFINKYLAPIEVVNLLKQSKFVICPYRDATQSGVLMTANALGRMAVASNVGAFPEYVQDGINGLLVNPNADDIAATIIQVLRNERYLELQSNIQSQFSMDISNANERVLLNAYHYSINNLQKRYRNGS